MLQHVYITTQENVTCWVLINGLPFWINKCYIEMKQPVLKKSLRVFDAVNLSKSTWFFKLS